MQNPLRFVVAELVSLPKLYGTPKYGIKFCLLNRRQYLCRVLIIAFGTPVARFGKDKASQLCKCFFVSFKNWLNIWGI